MGCRGRQVKGIALFEEFLMLASRSHGASTPANEVQYRFAAAVCTLCGLTINLKFI